MQPDWTLHTLGPTYMAAATGEPCKEGKVSALDQPEYPQNTLNNTVNLLPRSWERPPITRPAIERGTLGRMQQACLVRGSRSQDEQGGHQPQLDGASQARFRSSPQGYPPMPPERTSSTQTMHPLYFYKLNYVAAIMEL
eukprot:scaffold39028_cov16-Tisochrysis_lutea.AAC.2